MNDTLIQDSLKVAEKVVSQTAENNHNSSNLWMWLAIGEFAIIIGLVIASRIKRKPNVKQKFKEESIAQEVDFDNIINSSFHSNELYDIIKVKCHPDRFPTDPKLNEIAEKIFQEITKSKTNIKRLEELKIEAQQKLNINF
jgi:predicted RND superfamily exporter protein